MMPVGHTALYFDHLCADSPTTLRNCTASEQGVAVARYHRIGDLDWVATPIAPFLYGVDDPMQAPTFVTNQTADALRERYREAHLETIVPSPARKGEWSETIGSAFDRRLYLYEIDTTPQQDAALLAWLQSRPDSRRYSLLHANCADFAADAINLLYPHAIRRNRLGDFGMMTPKQVARAMEALGLTHPNLHLRVYEIPQLPGTLRRSRPLRGAAETFVKTKRYLAFFLVAQPELALADWIIYENKGKWKPKLPTQPLSPASWTAEPTVAVISQQRPAGGPSDSSASSSSLALSNP
jgi:hypothetical protein